MIDDKDRPTDEIEPEVVEPDAEPAEVDTEPLPSEKAEEAED